MPDEPYRMHAEQYVPRPLEEVFDFFSRAENLELLTPPWLNFHILSVQPNPVQQGTLIRYRMSWRVVPIFWTTRIDVWEPPHRFVDLQWKGPYRLWHHEHRFVREGSGTRIFDDVQYRLPFGWLGGLAHRWQVRGDVEMVFRYRQQAIERLFGGEKVAL